MFNFVLANTNALASAEGGVTTANYFTTYRTERSTTRSEELVQLDSVIALYEEGDAKYEDATQMKMEIVAAMEKELVLENISSNPWDFPTPSYPFPAIRTTSTCSSIPPNSPTTRRFPSTTCSKTRRGVVSGTS